MYDLRNRKIYVFHNVCDLKRLVQTTHEAKLSNSSAQRSEVPTLIPPDGKSCQLSSDEPNCQNQCELGPASRVVLIQIRVGTLPRCWAVFPAPNSVPRVRAPVGSRQRVRRAFAPPGPCAPAGTRTPPCSSEAGEQRKDLVQSTKR